MTCVATNTAAAVGGLTWLLLEYAFVKKWKVVGWCSGAVAALVAITPASGFVPPWSAVFIGIIGSASCYFATELKVFLGIDDPMDVFAIHAIGGIVGNLLT
jgi:ammonium transporter, Amt family